MTSKEQITRLADEDGGKGANLKGKSSTQQALTLQKTVRQKKKVVALRNGSSGLNLTDLKKQFRR